MKKAFKQVRLIITGKVQGVFFRANTKKVADEIGARGFVRNTEDGGVEVVAQGDGSQLDKLIIWCKKGPAISQVTNIEIIQEEIKDEFTGFNILY